MYPYIKLCCTPETSTICQLYLNRIFLNTNLFYVVIQYNTFSYHYLIKLEIKIKISEKGGREGRKEKREGERKRERLIGSIKFENLLYV